QDLHSFPTRRSSDLEDIRTDGRGRCGQLVGDTEALHHHEDRRESPTAEAVRLRRKPARLRVPLHHGTTGKGNRSGSPPDLSERRSEEHTSELQSLAY